MSSDVHPFTKRRAGVLTPRVDLTDVDLTHHQAEAVAIATAHVTAEKWVPSDIVAMLLELLDELRDERGERPP
jgi:hypothetical protein